MPSPDDSLGAELLSAVARLNRWATRSAALSIPPAQGRLLAQIEELGPARIGDLARADHCSQPTMTTQVQRLEDHGWATRTTDPADARAVLISITPTGSEQITEARRARAVAIDPLIAQLDETDRDRLQAAVGVLQGLLRQAGVHSGKDTGRHTPERA